MLVGKQSLPIALVIAGVALITIAVGILSIQPTLFKTANNFLYLLNAGIFTVIAGGGIIYYRNWQWTSKLIDEQSSKNEQPNEKSKWRRPNVYMTIVSIYLLILFAAVILEIAGYINSFNRGTVMIHSSYTLYILFLGAGTGAILNLLGRKEGIVGSLGALIVLMLSLSFSSIFNIPILVMNAVMIVLLIKGWMQGSQN